MKRSDKPIANPVVVLREEFDDWAILFNPDTADAVVTNPVGVVVWKLMDGKHSPDEILAEVRDRFAEVPDAASDHVAAFIQELVERGFVGYELQASGR